MANKRVRASPLSKVNKTQSEALLDFLVTSEETENVDKVRAARNVV